MADSKITALGELSAAPASGDLFVIVDVSDTSMAASGTNKKLTWANAVLALTNGTTTMASSQAQTFTNGVIAPKLYPSANSTTAVQITRADGSTAVITVDTSNQRVGIGKTPAVTMDVAGQLYCSSASYPPLRGERTTTSTSSVISGMQFVATTSGDMADGFGTQIVLAIQDNAAVVNDVGGIRVTRDGADTRSQFQILAGANAVKVTVRQDGKMGIGTVTPSATLHALESNAATNTIFDLVMLSGRSTGTVAAGFGAGVAVQLESSTTDDQAAGRLTFAWSTATHASRAAVGKLTAYYTSTERECLSWTADSTAATVLINGAGGVTAFNGNLQIKGSAVPTTGAGIEFHYVTGSAYGTIYAYDRDTPGYKDIIIGVDGNQLVLKSDGKVGLGVASPQAILHGHDGSGGFLFVNRTGVDSSLVTVIPDGTGDVTERLHMFGWVSNSAAFVSQVNETYLDVSSSTTKTDGSNTLTIAVTAAGAFTLQTTLGSATWKVLLWVFWR